MAVLGGDFFQESLNTGANINDTDQNGYPALMLAIIHRHKEVVRILLDRGADPNLRAANGPTH